MMEQQLWLDSFQVCAIKSEMLDENCKAEIIIVFLKIPSDKLVEYGLHS